MSQEAPPRPPPPKSRILGKSPLTVPHAARCEQLGLRTAPPTAAEGSPAAGAWPVEPGDEDSMWPRGAGGVSLCSGPSPELGGLGPPPWPAGWPAPCSQICTVGREPLSSRSTWGPGKLRARADGGPLKPPRRSSKKGPSLASGPGQGGSPGRAVPGAQLTEPSVQHGGRHGQQALRSRDLAAPSAPTSPGRDGRAHGEASGRQPHRSGTGFLTGRARVLPRGPGPSGPATGLPQQLPGRPQARVPKERRLR